MPKNNKQNNADGENSGKQNSSNTVSGKGSTVSPSNRAKKREAGKKGGQESSKSNN
jgi:hypothetical protein